MDLTMFWQTVFVLFKRLNDSQAFHAARINMLRDMTCCHRQSMDRRLKLALDR